MIRVDNLAFVQLQSIHSMPPNTTQANNQVVENPTGVLLVQCKASVGVSDSLMRFFSDRNIFISYHQSNVCDDHCFSRLEWYLGDQWEDQDEFSAEFASLADQLDAQFSVCFMSQSQSIGIFVSKQAHLLVDVLNKCQASISPLVDVSFIVANDQSMRQIADRYGVPFFFVDTEGDALEYEKQQLEIVQRYQPDYLGLAHYVNVLSAQFTQQANCPIVDVHRGFLSSLNNINTTQMAFEHGVKLVGATARFVTPELDQGPIIEQNVLTTQSADCGQEIDEVSRQVEQMVFSAALLKVLQHKVIVYKNRTIIFN